MSGAVYHPPRRGSELLIVSNREIHGHRGQRETHAGGNGQRKAALQHGQHPPTKVRGHARRSGDVHSNIRTAFISAGHHRPATASAMPATAAPATP